MQNPEEILTQGNITTEKALMLFDQLEEVDVDFMIGKWQGSGLHTDHPLDGLLESYGWYGKEFIDAENVHPLIFTDKKETIFIIDPIKLPMSMALKLPILKNSIVKVFFLSIRFLFKTKKPRARLRLLETRGKKSAAMIYDDLPIIDSFRKVDDNTVLGLMDYRLTPQPFFFMLRRR
jgi:hypothetical protein